MRLPAFLRRSVRAKITALVVATTLVALVVSAIALIYYTMHDYRETLLSDIRTQADILGRASAAALAFTDRKEAAQDLSTLKARPDIEQAALYDADGRLFATYARSETPAVPLRAEESGYRIEAGRLVLFYPVFEAGQLVGTVYLQSRYRLFERLSAYVVILAVVMAAALAAALALSAWLQRAVTEPILRVAKAAQAVVEERNFSVRAGDSSEDEIGVLAKAMNHMLTDLEREIDERRGAEEALRVLDRRKDEFLATLAHELRNPLAPIRNAVYLMQAAPDNPTIGTEARAMIERHVRQMVRLVDDLLDVSRITTGKLALHRKRADLRALVGAALESAMPLVRERGHKLNVELPPEGLSIDADATRLIQVFLNLINNAAKFTPPQGHIDFEVTVQGRDLVAIVRDDGTGIAPDMLSEIFEIFVQADRSLERTSAGLGVGLSLSRRLVELHGGTLEAKSEGLDKGAEFSVRIPGIVMEAAPSQPAAGESTNVDASVHRILVVDDNRDFTDSTAMLLSSLGHEVRVAYDGAAGLASAALFAPHFALLDIGMPKLNGFELAQRLRDQEVTARTILVAISGWGQADDQRRALAAGFDEFLVKPVDPERIVTLLQRHGPTAHTHSESRITS